MKYIALTLITLLSSEKYVPAAGHVKGCGYAVSTSPTFMGTIPSSGEPLFLRFKYTEVDPSLVMIPASETDPKTRVFWSISFKGRYGEQPVICSFDRKD